MARFSAGAPPPSDNIFRSEEMVYIQMYMQQDAAHNTVEDLGDAEVVEFTDLNPTMTAFQRPFALNIKRCEEILRKIRLFQDLLASEGVSPLAAGPSSETLTIDEVFSQADEFEAALLEANKHINELSVAQSKDVERRVVLESSEGLIRGYQYEETLPVDGATGEESLTTQLLAGDMELSQLDEHRVRTICGAISEHKVSVLERVLFRITRGNCVVKFAENTTTLSDVRHPGTLVTKRVFAVFFYSKRVEDRIVKVIEALGGSRYSFDSQLTKRQQQIAELSESIREISTVLERTRIQRRAQLEQVSSLVQPWEIYVSREKKIFHTLNKLGFDVNRNGVVGEGWCPKRRWNDVKRALQSGAERSGVTAQTVCNEVVSYDTPPTFFKTNKLTSGFQAIVDAYGVAGYRELNPTPFTVITFPFLFAVMFGDIGHGLLLLFFAIYMIAREKYYAIHPPGEIFGISFGGRYVVLLMGLFSVYTGFLYNETFSLSINMFDSPYSYHEIPSISPNITNYTVVKEDRTYPFGVDPIWKQADNELTFTNNLKMKMSIVFGVTQMLFGITLSAFNYVHFRDYVSLINKFIPQFLFLSSIFGYMVFLIIFKWLTHYPKTTCAPSILSTFITMFLSLGAVEPINTDYTWCEHNGFFFQGQEKVQLFLLVIAVVTVPWMLLAKPLFDYCKHHFFTPNMTRLGDGEHQSVHHGVPYDFAEEMVHNIIHTIEFVLGAVSNTASYLRLWALSLAHAQLSTVFWEKAVADQLAEGKGSIPMLIPGIFVWIMCTLGVLMVMESLSAFLHALRLHWVEFQNKFYNQHGGGRKFVAFSFKTSLVEDGES